MSCHVILGVVKYYIFFDDQGGGQCNKINKNMQIIFKPVNSVIYLPFSLTLVIYSNLHIKYIWW